MSEYPDGFNRWHEADRNAFFADRAQEYAAKKAKRGGNGAREHVAPEPALPAIKFKTLLEFFQENVSDAEVIEGLILLGYLYTLTARTGHGKTAWLVMAALAVATGRSDILGREVMRGRVLYMTFENPDDVRKRLMIAAYRHNVSAKDIARDIIILDARRKPEEIIEAIGREIEGNGPLSLVIIDTLAAFFDGKDANDAVQFGEFLRRLRPITRMPGKASIVIAAHPVKNAPQDNLLPFGSGAIVNEIDGNLVLWKDDSGFTSLHWHGKFRGVNFEPVPFRFENISSPDIIDVKGRQILLPVLLPSSDSAIEQRASADSDIELALLRQMEADPNGGVISWAISLGRDKSRITRKLQNLEKRKFVEKPLGKWRLTAKGSREAKNAS